MGFLRDAWKKQKKQDPEATPGFREWLHRAGIQTDDDLVEIMKNEVPLMQPRQEE